MSPLPLTSGQVDDLLFQSEGRATTYSGGNLDPRHRAHSLARHYLITNSNLQGRVDSTRHGEIALFTAFITRKDMIDAGVRLLNSPIGLWARSQLFDIRASSAQPRGSHTGMRAVIEYHGDWKCLVRYAGGEGIMPVYSFKMLLDRIDERSLRLHVHTFYPTLQFDTDDSKAQIWRQNQTKFSYIELKKT